MTATLNSRMLTLKAQTNLKTKKDDLNMAFSESLLNSKPIKSAYRGKWGKANYLRKDLDLCFTGFCFLLVITTKGKFRISALIFLWTTFHCICYKLEKFNIEENKMRFGILKIVGQSGPLLVHAAPCDQKIIIFPNNIVFIAQKHAAYVTTTANQLC